MKKHYAPQFDLELSDFALAGETQAAPAPAPAPTAPAPVTPDLFPGLEATRAPKPQARRPAQVQTWDLGDDELPIPAPHVPLHAPLPPACACVSSCAGCRWKVLPGVDGEARPVCFVARGYIAGAWDRDGRPTPEDFHEGDE